MPALNQFRGFQICQTPEGDALEIERSGDQVICLAFDNQRGCLVELLACGNDPQIHDLCQNRATRLNPLHARLLDFGEEDGVLYCASEFVDGEPFESYVRRVGPLPDPVAADLLRRLLAAVHDSPEILLRENWRRARLFVKRNGLLSIKCPHPLPPAEAAASPLVRALALYRVLSGASPEWRRAEEEVGSLDALAALLQADAASGPLALPPSHDPRHRLEDEILAGFSPVEFLAEQFEFHASDTRARDPWRHDVRDSQGASLTVHVLPPERMVDAAHAMAYDGGGNPAIVPVHSYWRDDRYRLLVEERVDGFSLAELLLRRPQLSPMEGARLLRKFDAAAKSVQGAELEVHAHPESWVFDFPNAGNAEWLNGSVLDWPEFRVRMRAHPTMRTLTDYWPKVDDPGGQQLVENLQRHGTVSSWALFSRWFDASGDGRNLIAMLEEWGVDESIDEQPDEVGAPMVSPIAAALNPDLAAPSVPRLEDTGGIAVPEDIGSPPSGRWRWILLVLAAVAIAAAIAHFTGKAFWLRS